MRERERGRRSSNEDIAECEALSFPASSILSLTQQNRTNKHLRTYKLKHLFGSPLPLSLSLSLSYSHRYPLSLLHIYTLSILYTHILPLPYLVTLFLISEPSHTNHTHFVSTCNTHLLSNSYLHALSSLRSTQFVLTTYLPIYYLPTRFLSPPL